MKKLLKLVMCVGVATLPHFFTLGLINNAQAESSDRLDLNGLLLNNSNNNRVYWIDQGKRRWINGPAVFNQLKSI